MGAYASMPVRGMHPMVTDIASIEDAVMAYLDGRIVNHVDRSRWASMYSSGLEAGENGDELWKCEWMLNNAPAAARALRFAQTGRFAWARASPFLTRLFVHNVSFA
jgi:hypothetical protein